MGEERGALVIKGIDASERIILYGYPWKLKKPNKAIDENSSLSYGASPAIWITQCYLPPYTSERAPP